MWAMRGSVPRLILIGTAASVLSTLTALGSLLVLDSAGIRLYHSAPVLAVSVVSNVVGMITTGVIVYALYMDELEVMAAADKGKGEP